MKYHYYVKEAIDRLFRHAPATGRQERWDANTEEWVNVAPNLADDIYSGRVELEEITEFQVVEKYPKAMEA